MNLFQKLGQHADLVGGMSDKLGLDWAEKLEAHPDLAAR
ncbi:MAG: adenylosuccinate lyase, partial [Rhodobacteraceae bacterium]|nr:adenylosuccinate lyase [Paracoccaceae bacterium]